MIGKKVVVSKCVAVGIFFAATLSCGSIIEDDLPLDDAPPQLAFRIAAGEISRTKAYPGYDDGTSVEWENYINPADVRFYFFGTDNKFISEFVPEQFTPVSQDASTSKLYDVTGSVHGKLPSDFKIVVMANYDGFRSGIGQSSMYPQTLAPGRTTIAQVCDAGIFDYVVPMRLSQSRPLPMYGVKTCQNVLWADKERIRLGTVNMLRSLAKVELTCSSDRWTIGNVTLHNYNSRGYFAPENLCDESDYYRDAYIQTPHLVGGDNDATEKSCSFDKLAAQRFVIYIPEYSNSVISGRSYIEVGFLERADRTYRIDFGTYSDGVFQESSDIRRNYFYRFDINKLAENSAPVVSADVYRYDLFDLNPGFGQ